MRKMASLRARRQPHTIQFSAIAEAYEGLKEEESVKWLAGAMEPISQEYTRETFTQAERVRTQLTTRFRLAGMNPDFEYQGSVTNDTHIEYYSDIDLLVLHGEVVTWDKRPEWCSAYGGDIVADLVKLRAVSGRVKYGQGSAGQKRPVIEHLIYFTQRLLGKSLFLTFPPSSSQ